MGKAFEALIEKCTMANEDLAIGSDAGETWIEGKPAPAIPGTVSLSIGGATVLLAIDDIQEVRKVKRGSFAVRIATETSLRLLHEPKHQSDRPKPSRGGGSLTVGSTRAAHLLSLLHG